MELYETKDLYQEISKIMTYNEDLFSENIDMVTHPKNSPIPPAEYALANNNEIE